MHGETAQSYITTDLPNGTTDAFNAPCNHRDITRIGNVTTANNDYLKKRRCHGLATRDRGRLRNGGRVDHDLGRSANVRLSLGA
jgi:hypothetical protein